MMTSKRTYLVITGFFTLLSALASIPALAQDRQPRQIRKHSNHTAAPDSATQASDADSYSNLSIQELKAKKAEFSKQNSKCGIVNYRLGNGTLASLARTPGQRIGDLFAEAGHALEGFTSRAGGSSAGVMSQDESDAGWCKYTEAQARLVDQALTAKEANQYGLTPLLSAYDSLSNWLSVESEKNWNRNEQIYEDDIKKPVSNWIDKMAGSGQ